METKFCRKCGLEKSVELFSKSKITKDGLQSKCKECFKSKKIKYWSKNARLGELTERDKKYIKNCFDMDYPVQVAFKVLKANERKIIKYYNQLKKCTK